MIISSKDYGKKFEMNLIICKWYHIFFSRRFILSIYTFISLNCLTDAIVNKISSGGLKTNSVDLDDDEDGGTDSAQDLEGSADQPLDF